MNRPPEPVSQPGTTWNYVQVMPEHYVTALATSNEGHSVIAGCRCGAVVTAVTYAAFIRRWRTHTGKEETSGTDLPEVR